MKRSKKFWLVFYIVSLTIIGFINWEILLGILVCISFLTIGAFFDGMEINEHPWLYLSPLFWLLVLIGSIVMGISFCWENTIGRLNNYLDKNK